MNVESKKVSDRRTMSNLCAVVPLQSHEHQVTLHMPRQVTAAQERARDALAEAIEIKYDCFFSMAQKTHTKIKNIFSRSKSRNRNPGHVF